MEIPGLDFDEPAEVVEAVKDEAPLVEEPVKVEEVEVVEADGETVVGVEEADEGDVEEGVKIVSHPTDPFELPDDRNFGEEEDFTGVDEEYVEPKVPEPRQKVNAAPTVPDGLPPGAKRTPYDERIEDLPEKPWRNGLDISEYFNYDMNEHKWKVV